MNNTVTFPIAGNDHPYAGMPLFDGCPEHLNDYLDALLMYAGDEGALLWANEYRHDYVLTTGAHAGSRIPGTLFWGPATDSVQGYKTDFPCMLGLGQSWNRELVRKAGEVLGKEYITQTDHNNIDSASFSAMVCTAMQDLRINPLSGRFDEGYSEDPMLCSEMVDAMARGVSGIDDPGNPDGFYTRSIVLTKHFTTYGGQTFRMAQSSDIGIRALMENQIKAPVKGVRSGALSGFMMSFGRSNGVPNTISPAVSHLQKESPYGLYTTPDIFGTSMFWTQDSYRDGVGNFSNHYEKSYLEPEYKATSAALMAHAKSGGFIMTPETVENDMKELLRILDAGVASVTADEVRAEAKRNLVPYVRMGFLNADLSRYPFLDEETSGADETVPMHLETALQAARESIVLLKNNGILPLTGKESLAISGNMAESRFKTVYAARNLPDLPDCGLTVKESLQARYERTEGTAFFHNDCKKVRILADGLYLTITDRDPVSPTFGKLGFTADRDQAEVFEQYSWGQARAFSFKSISSGLWFSTNGVQEHFIAPIVPTRLAVNEAMDLVMRNTTLSGVLSGITLPTRIRLEEQADHRFLFLIHGFNESLLQLAPDAYYTMGRYIVKDGDSIHFTEPLTSPEHAEELKAAALRFTFETVSEIAEDTVSAAASGTCDTAVVVIGAGTRHSAGEGVDRSDLAMGEDSYELVRRVADAYPGRTVVVVNSSFPVLMKEIEEDPKVAAIVYQPYAGQYDGYAMADVLTGAYAPTGRLTSTWYASVDALPALDAYSVPEGPDSEHKPDRMDPRLVSDLRKQDLIAEKLTYQYTDAEVTYPVGHGLSYSTFTYSDLEVAAWDDVTIPLQLSVKVTNTGAVDTAEVVQVYVTNPDSAYGNTAPKKMLAAFEKVTIAAGASATVTLRILPEDIALWDVNAGEYFVEAGTYRLQVGTSSETILLEAKLPVFGRRLTVLDPEKTFSLFGRTALSDRVTYRERGKKQTVASLMKQDGCHGMDNEYFSIMSKEDGAWAKLTRVDLTGKTAVTAEIASIHKVNRLELHLDTPDGVLLAAIDCDGTEPVRYTLPNTGAQPEAYPPMPAYELGYRAETAPLSAAVSGIHDVYIVFRNPDLRVGSMSIR